MCEHCRNGFSFYTEPHNVGLTAGQWFLTWRLIHCEGFDYYCIIRIYWTLLGVILTCPITKTIGMCIKTTASSSDVDANTLKLSRKSGLHNLFLNNIF